MNVQMVKAVGDILCVFETEQPFSSVVTTRCILRSSVKSAKFGPISTATTTWHRSAPAPVTRILSLHRGAEPESIPLTDEEFIDVMTWLAGARWPPDEITGISDLNARRAAWRAWERENAKS